MSKKKVVKSGSQDGTASEGSFKGSPDPDSIPGIPEHHKIIHLPLDKVFCEENSSGLETILQDLNVLFSSVGTVITVEGTSLTIDIFDGMEGSEDSFPAWKENMASHSEMSSGARRFSGNDKVVTLATCTADSSVGMVVQGIMETYIIPAGHRSWLDEEE